MRVYRVSAELRQYKDPDTTSEWYSGRCFLFDVHADNYAHAKKEAESILQDACDGMQPEHWLHEIQFIVPTVFPSYPRSDR